MKTIGLISNLEQDKIIDLLEEIRAWLAERGVKLLVDDECARRVSWSYEACLREELVNRVDCLMILGGDGTLLHGARLAAPAKVPVFGVNMGRLGFLTEVDMPNLFKALVLLLNGEYAIEERMMLEAGVIRDNQTSPPLMGLNDAVITKGGLARLIRLDTQVNRQHFNTYHADGVIIATPTGSTAYSLSAGGPLVVPELDLLLFTPICPHALWGRPLVIPPDNEVRITLQSDQADVMLTVDGQLGMQLQNGDVVLIKKSPYRARFIKLNHQTFFDILRQKFTESAFKRESG
ncbi:MAG: NAD(+)/NADH kinase [Firmicutes bacterium]|nr:NAD(+)/NADH kinase [Bacillota bacterium]